MRTNILSVQRQWGQGFNGVLSLKLFSQFKREYWIDFYMCSITTPKVHTCIFFPYSLHMCVYPVLEIVRTSYISLEREREREKSIITTISPVLTLFILLSMLMIQSIYLMKISCKFAFVLYIFI